MKDKILMLVLGILIGAVITAGGFLIFGNNKSNSNMPQMGQFDSNNIPTDRGNKGDMANMVAPDDSKITTSTETNSI